MINISHTLLGNEKLLNTLVDSFNNKFLSNSIILYGPKGIGKNTLAFNFIKKIYTEYLNNNDKTKEHINQIYNFNHLNIRYIKRQYDEKTKKLKKNILIDQIRILENFLYQTSLSKLPKFVVIDSADELNANSSNSLLKILEEPKNNTYFILISHQISSLLPTIRSRCVKFKVDAPEYQDFIKIFRMHDKNIDENNLNFLYNLSSGSPGLSLEISEINFNEIYKNIINILIDKKSYSKDIILLSEVISIFSNDEYKVFLSLLKFILISVTKINLDCKLDSNLPTLYYNQLLNLSKNIDNIALFTILDYINDNEDDLYIFNLDKKIFFLNIFESLKE